MGTKSRESLFGIPLRIAEDAAKRARERADTLACKAWNIRMKGFGGPAQPSPTLGDAMNGGYGFLEVLCNGCKSYTAIDLTIVRQPKETPVWKLERWLRCKYCSEQRGYPYKRSQVIRLRREKVTVCHPTADED